MHRRDAEGRERCRREVLEIRRDDDLRARSDGRLFCSPWLRSADGNIEHQAALGRFRARMTTAIAASTVEARLAEGNVLLVDNRRFSSDCRPGAVGVDFSRHERRRPLRPQRPRRREAGVARGRRGRCCLGREEPRRTASRERSPRAPPAAPELRRRAHATVTPPLSARAVFELLGRLGEAVEHVVLIGGQAVNV